MSLFEIIRNTPAEAGRKDARDGNKANPPIRNNLIDFRTNREVDEDVAEYYRAFKEERNLIDSGAYLNKRNPYHDTEDKYRWL